MAQEGRYEELPPQNSDNRYEDLSSQYEDLTQTTPVRARGAGPAARGEPPPPARPVNPEIAGLEQIEQDPNLGLFAPLTMAPKFVTDAAKKASTFLNQPITRKKDVEPKAPLDLSKVPASRRAEIEKLYQSDQFETSADPLRAFTGGALEGAAEMASPLNIGLAAVGMGEVGALNKAQKLLALGKVSQAASAARTARNFETLTRVASAGVGANAAIESGKVILNPDKTLGEKGLELLPRIPELAGAALGMRERVRPTLAQSRIPNLSGQAAPGTPDIPLRLNEAGTFAPEDLDLNLPVRSPSAPVPVAEPSTGLSFRPPSITLKPGPTQMQQIVRMSKAGYKVVGSDDKGVRMVPTDAPVPQSMPSSTGEQPPQELLAEGGYAGPERRKGERKGIQYRGEELTPDSPIRAMEDISGSTRAIMEEDPELVRKANDMANTIRSLKESHPRSTKSPMAQETLDLLDRGKELLPPDEPAFSKDIDPNVAIIEDTGPKWEGYGPNGEDYFNVAIPKPSGASGKLEYSHGILDPEQEAALKESGLKIVKRSELEPQTSRDTTDEELFGPMSTEDIFKSPRTIFGVPEPQKGQFRIDMNNPQVREIMSMENKQQVEDLAFELGSRIREIDKENVRTGGRSGDLSPEHKQLIKEYNAVSRRLNELTPRMEDVQFNRPVDEFGTPIETGEFTPEQLQARKKEIATAWYKARLQARSLGIDDKQYRNLDDLRLAIRGKQAEPSFQKTEEEGGMDVGNPREMIEIFVNTYAKDIASVATKELLQNALDATKGMGDEGLIKIEIDEHRRTFGIEDNGPGLLPDEFKELYLKLSASGKRGKGLGTIGELGVGKVSYLLGGDSVTVTSVATDPKTGKTYETTMTATREELLSKTAKIHSEEVSSYSPTGITTVVTFKEGADMYSPSQFLSNYLKYSSHEANIKINKKSLYGKLPDETHPPAPYKPLKVLHNGEVKGSTKYQISIPNDAQVRESDSILLVLTSRGMFQGVDHVYVAKGQYPSHLVLNLDPTVIGTSDKYPLTAPVRENLKSDVKREIKLWIDENIVKKGVQDRLSELKRIYDGMNNNTLDTGEYTLLDGGERFTPEEMQLIKSSKDLTILGDNISEVMAELMASLPDQDELEGPLSRIGFLFEEKVGGVNLKDPTGDQFTILVNPFELAYDRKLESVVEPKELARRIVHTSIHEFAHLKERNEGSSFTWFLGRLYGYYPLERQLGAYERILSGVTGIDGGYTPEFQELLSKYFDSRRRRPTTKDTLLGERGINSFTESIGPQATRVHNQPSGTGIPINRVGLKYEKAPAGQKKKLVKAALDAGFISTGFRDPSGNPIWERPDEQPGSKLAELWNLPRGAMSVDLPFLTSAALRQGATAVLVDPAAWARAWYNSMRAYGSKAAAEMIKDEISNHPYFKRGQDASGKETPSYAEQIGLPLTDTSSLTKREEVIKSNWAEKIPLWGRHVAASNRAYTAFLNTIRGSSLIKFTDQAKLDAALLKDPNLDPTKNLILGKEISDAIGVLTGRGKAELELTPETRFTKSRKISLERSIETLVNVFFSPRLQASRAKMININTYISASPVVRKMYLKGAMSLLAVWGTIAGLAKLAGIGDIELDPNSADFGKIRVGNTRYDPGAGFQQFFVLLSRHFSGQFKSSTSEEEPRTMRKGFRAITPGEVTQNFISSKLHPSAKFIYDYEFARDDRPFYVGDRTLQLFVPMFASGLSEVLEEDKLQIPPILLGGSLGLGAQTYEGGEQPPQITPLLDKIPLGIPFSELDVRVPPED